MNRQTSRAIVHLGFLVSLLLNVACGASVPPPATATLAPSATTIATSTPVPTFTPVPTPTPDLERRLEEGLLALRNGEYAVADEHLRVLTQAADVTYRQTSLPALARARFLNGDFAGVIDLADEETIAALPDEDRAVVQGLVARSHDALGQWQAAIDAYERYLALDDAAAFPVRLEMARAFKALGNPAQALQQLEMIDPSALDPSSRADVLEEQSALRLLVGDVDGAVAALDAILGFAQQVAYRAAILQRKGQLLVNQNRVPEGLAVLQEVLGSYRSTNAAYWALQTLDEHNVADIDDLARGQILYEAQEYESSIVALDRYREKNPNGYWSTAYYYTGMAQYRLKRYDDALESLNTVIRRFASSQVAGDAWMAYGRVLEASGGDAAGHYERFATLYPDHARAPEALWLAAVEAERRGDWAHAGELHTLIYTRYPSNTRAADSQFRVGLAAYGQGNPAAARAEWEKQLEGASGTTRTRLLTWLGLASASANDMEGARAWWEQAMQASPSSYYGLRARDLIAGTTPTSAGDYPLAPKAAVLGEQEWQEIKDWVATFAPPGDAETDQPELASVRRAQALWYLNWTSEAMSTYRRVQQDIYRDAQAVLRLFKAAAKAEVHPVTIWCAERLMAMGRDAAATEPPPVLNQVAYPAPWSELVGRETEANGIDPLLFLALMRQESLFQAGVSSSAGAIGLSQIMPATGEWIAQQLGDTAYEVSWLQRPHVNVKYGVWYLSHALDLFGGNWMAALAAYNGGPASVSRWTGGQPITDPDLFFETIGYSETRTYVQRVYEYYRRYQQIYGTD